MILDLDPKHVDRELQAFLLEIYAYLVSIANVTVNKQPTLPDMILDPFVTRPERLKSCKATGSMFGYARDLITLIPSICTLGYNRLLEDDTTGSPAFNSVALHNVIHSKILCWEEPKVEANSGSDTKELVAAAKVYKEAILIFLHTAFHASQVEDSQLLALLRIHSMLCYHIPVHLMLIHRC